MEEVLVPLGNQVWLQLLNCKRDFFGYSETLKMQKKFICKWKNFIGLLVNDIFSVFPTSNFCILFCAILCMY